MNQNNKNRIFCFLQGPAGYFFWRLGQALRGCGCRTVRINFCAGDRFNWPGKAKNFRGRFENWQKYLEQQFRDEGVTDLILLGEQRPYHRVAVSVAQEMGIQVVVFELGYLRPDWLTLELDGMSGNSRFPRDPQVISNLAKALPPAKSFPVFSSSFFIESCSDLAFHFANLVFGIFYPSYRTHLLSSPLLLDIGIGIHILLAKLQRKSTAQKIALLLRSKKPFFVFPLQIENDYQIRAYSPFHSIAEAIDEVLISFAHHAPKDSVLVIKEHPREVIGQRWHHLCHLRASELGVQDRLLTLDGGHLAKLLQRAKGTVTINSTSGIQALIFGCPTKVLGDAIFDLPGLAERKHLDQFWCDPQSPDPDLRDHFIRLLTATIQVKGTLYSTEGSAHAIKEIVERLIHNRVNQPLDTHHA